MNTQLITIEDERKLAVSVIKAQITDLVNVYERYEDAKDFLTKWHTGERMASDIMALIDHADTLVDYSLKMDVYIFLFKKIAGRI